MNQLILFALLSIPLIIISRKPLMNPKSHGFYRFFGWEGMAWIFSCNYRYWFADPVSIRQLISWVLLAISIYYVVAGAVLLIGKGKPREHRNDESLYQFEKTSELVETGLYKYIRHPLYGSLIFLTWGIFLKNITWTLLAISVLTTIFFYLTARRDEKECVTHFGEKYTMYMKKSAMFVPLLF
jgi:protein-S-isoprenylcysteine O-methyltransferase Ste14